MKDEPPIPCISEIEGSVHTVASAGSIPANGSPASSYIKNPLTPEDHLSNCQFQIDNVKGWMMMVREEGGAGSTAAKIKAECLVEAAQLLVKSIQAERGERENAPG